MRSRTLVRLPVGRAGFILDNLIASGEAQPMIVVMPHGHTSRNGAGVAGQPVAEFASEFASDIRPYIEANYRVRTDRSNRAIAGLSMGGAQTLDIAMSGLAEYGYLGVFSAGVFGIEEDDSWQVEHQDTLDNERLRDGLELVWFSTGTDDFLLSTTEATVEMLSEHGFGVTYRESTGGHTWINWREYLREFTPLLFR